MEREKKTRVRNPYLKREQAAARLRAIGRDATSETEIIEAMASVLNGNAPPELRCNLAIELAALTQESLNPKPEIEQIKKHLGSCSAEERLAAARELLDRALRIGLK